METEKLTTEILAKRFSTESLKDVTTKKLAEEVDDAISIDLPAEKKDPTNDPRSKNPYTFPFEWKDPRGKVWKGMFTTHYPTPLDLIKAGTMQSRLLGGAPKESLDALTDEIAFMVSRLTFCLDSRPDWFSDPLNIIDGVPLLQAVYSEVLSFESFFRQFGKIEKASATKLGDI